MKKGSAAVPGDCVRSEWASLRLSGTLTCFSMIKWHCDFWQHQVSSVLHTIYKNKQTVQMKDHISIKQKNYQASCTAFNHPNSHVSTSALFWLQTGELLSIYSRSIMEDVDGERPGTRDLNAKKPFFPSKSEETRHVSLLQSSVCRFGHQSAEFLTLNITLRFNSVYLCATFYENILFFSSS